MNKNLLAHIAVLTANLIYGINYTVAKDVMNGYIGSFGLVLTRVIGGFLIFTLLRPNFKKDGIKKEDIPRFMACGLFGITINQLFFLEGLSMTTQINAGIIMTTNPIMVLMMAAFILKEKITRRKILGIVVGLSGAVLLMTYGKTISLGQSGTFLGNLMVFINSLSYGIYLVIAKPLINKYDTIVVVKWVFMFGLLFVFPFGYSQMTAVNWAEMPTIIYLETAFVILGTSVLAYLFNMYGLKKLNASGVSFYIYSQPIFASIVAIMVGHDSLNAIKIISAALVFAGVYIVSKPAKVKA